MQRNIGLSLSREESDPFIKQKNQNRWKTWRLGYALEYVLGGKGGGGGGMTHHNT